MAQQRKKKKSPPPPKKKVVIKKQPAPVKKVENKKTASKGKAGRPPKKRPVGRPKKKRPVGRPPLKKNIPPVKGTNKGKKAKVEKVSNKRLNKGSSGYFKVHKKLKEYFDGSISPGNLREISKQVYASIKEDYKEDGKFKLTTEIIQDELGSRRKIGKVLKETKAPIEYETFDYDYYNLDDEMELRVGYKSSYDVDINLQAIDESIIVTTFGSMKPVEIIQIVNDWRDMNGGQEFYGSGDIQFKERFDVVNRYISIVLVVKDEPEAEFGTPHGEGPVEEFTEPVSTGKKKTTKEPVEPSTKTKESPKQEEETSSEIKREQLRKIKGEADLVEINKLNSMIKALYEEAKLQKDIGENNKWTLAQIIKLKAKRDKLI